MAATNPVSSRLAALTAAALALPGMTPKAQAEGLNPEIDTAFSRYEESDNRMRVDVYQAVGSLAIGDRWTVKANGVKDVVSGASPVANGFAGKQLAQIRSRASIRDVRDEVDLSANYAFDEGSAGVNVGRSSENDYTSDFFNIDGRWDVNDNLTTLAAGFGFASDQVWAVTNTGKGQHERVPGLGGDKSTFQSLLGVTQVLDKNSLLQANLTYTHNEGYLADPYKYALVLAPSPAVVCDPGYALFGCYTLDSRPSNRDQFNVLLRYVRNFGDLNAAALHLDYRFYADTWDISAHTFEATWYQPIYDGWMLNPHVRYYSQCAAEFYQPYFATARSDGHYSTDYRMADFGAVSGGAQLSKELLDRLRIAAAVDFYRREQGYGMQKGAGTALDNFSYSVFTVSLDLKF